MTRIGDDLQRFKCETYCSTVCPSSLSVHVWMKVIFYRVRSVRPYLPPATKLGQGNVFTGVCDSVHKGGGVCLSACLFTPQEQTPSPPPRSRPPRSRPPWTRHPPRADPTPGAEHAGIYGQRAGGTHTYWNAIL